MLWVYDHQSLSRDTNKFTFQLRFIMDVVKSGPTYRVKSREIPLSAHWPCAIIDRATAGGVGRFHNRKGAINVPCNDLNSWIIPAEDRRGFLSLSLSFSAYFSPLFAVLFHLASLSLDLIRENPLRECLLSILERRSPDEISRRSREFQFWSWTISRYDRGERSICLWKREGIEVVTI